MDFMLSLRALAETGIPVVILGAGGYALPVRFRIQKAAVDCIVPTWAEVGERLGESGEVTIAAVERTEPHLRWLFIRGKAHIVSDPAWEDLKTSGPGEVPQRELYQVLRIEPTRMERVDEEWGWGIRETMDF